MPPPIAPRDDKGVHDPGLNPRIIQECEERVQDRLPLGQTGGGGECAMGGVGRLAAVCCMVSVGVSVLRAGPSLEYNQLIY